MITPYSIYFLALSFWDYSDKYNFNIRNFRSMFNEKIRKRTNICIVFQVEEAETYFPKMWKHRRCKQLSEKSNASHRIFPLDASQCLHMRRKTYFR